MLGIRIQIDEVASLKSKIQVSDSAQRDTGSAANNMDFEVTRELLTSYQLSCEIIGVGNRPDAGYIKDAFDRIARVSDTIFVYVREVLEVGELQLCKAVLQCNYASSGRAR
jgi:hypothetical protein